MVRTRRRWSGLRYGVLAVTFAAALPLTGPAAVAHGAPAAAQQRVPGQAGAGVSRAAGAQFTAFLTLHGRKQVTAAVRVPGQGRARAMARRLGLNSLGYQTQHVTTTLRRAHAANVAAAAPGWSGGHATGIRVAIELAAATLGVGGAVVAVSGWVQLAWATLAVAAVVDFYRQAAAVRAASAPDTSLAAAAKAVLGTLKSAFAAAPEGVQQARAATLNIAAQNGIAPWRSLAGDYGLQPAAR